MVDSQQMRLCLDTNIYILGIQETESQERKILEVIGFFDKKDININAQIILSAELIDQIRRVGKYLYGKDKAGIILGQFWSQLNTYYVIHDNQWFTLFEDIKINSNIPTEDIEIFLTAKLGKADCFVSGNRELLNAIADFECLTPDNFINKYLK